MATIIDLPQNQKVSTGSAGAELVIFPGVRRPREKDPETERAERFDQIRDIISEESRIEWPEIERLVVQEPNKRIDQIDYGNGKVEETRYLFASESKFPYAIEFVRFVDGVERFRGLDYNLDGKLEMMDILHHSGRVKVLADENVLYVAQEGRSVLEDAHQVSVNSQEFSDPRIVYLFRKRKKDDVPHVALLERVKGRPNPSYTPPLKQKTSMPAEKVKVLESLTDGKVLATTYFFREGNKYSSSVMRTLVDRYANRIWRTLERPGEELLCNRYLREYGEITKVVGLSIKT